MQAGLNVYKYLIKNPWYCIIGSRLSSRTDIGTDFVQKIIRREANEAVEYLKKREAFWEMLEIRKDKDSLNQHVESYRWLM